MSIRFRLLFVGLLATPWLALAQFNCAVQGTVTDPSGGGVPDAAVRARNLATGVTRETVSSTEGVYRILSLAPGPYEVTVEKTGFSKAKRSSIPLGAGGSVKVDFVIELGAVSQEVTVAAQTSSVETEQSEVSGRISETQVRELPLNGRNLLNLLALQPGVTGRGLSSSMGTNSSGNDSFSGETAPAVYGSGMRYEANDFSVNDSSTNEVVRPGVSNLVPGADTVEEVELVTNNFSATEGRSSGARVQLITKSGTNEFHGGASEYFTNNTLSSRNVFSSVIPVFRKNEFTAFLGGPIKKQRTFFFADYEGLRQSGAPEFVNDFETPT